MHGAQTTCNPAVKAAAIAAAAAAAEAAAAQLLRKKELKVAIAEGKQRKVGLAPGSEGAQVGGGPGESGRVRMIRTVEGKRSMHGYDSGVGVGADGQRAKRSKVLVPEGA